VLSSFAQWRDPQTVLELASLAVLTRRADLGRDTVDRSIAADVSGVSRSALDTELARRATLVPTRRVDVSSTEIRDRVRSGRSIHGFVTDAVAEYIRSHGLYR
jgi:nicotinate-nucleotide adenylyltransferase